MPPWLPYAAVLAVILLAFVLPEYVRMRRDEKRAIEVQRKAMLEGSHEPVSIRPYVNLSRCMGSRACILACPEQSVLELIAGQAAIAKGSSCVGHGACEAACPVKAIELVFGSERRGIDIPAVRPDFQTNVPGIYIAGELGGMGLIANAVRQGVEAVENLAKGLQRGPLDLVIVGAGPAGLGAGLRAKELGLSYELLEQSEFGGAIRHYPRQKLAMTRPLKFPLFGTINERSIRKEALVKLLEDILEQTGLKVSAPERVDAVESLDGGRFRVRTDKRELECSRVLIAVGRRGTPRQLGVPGEDQEKVAYRLLDPELYQHQHVLVVGGGDSGVEAAVALGEQLDTKVTYSYMDENLTRPRPQNQERLRKAVEAGQVRTLPASTVTRIEVDRVVLDQRGQEVVVANDFVFVFAGGVLPTAFLATAGIRMERHFGKRIEELPPAE